MVDKHTVGMINYKHTNSMFVLGAKIWQGTSTRKKR